VKQASDIRLILAYKNFAAFSGISHIGLGVSALNTSKVLVNAGIHAEVVPITRGEDLEAFLAADTERTITHVVISAPWIPTVILNRMSLRYPRVKFATNCHSNTAFLQADANGVRLIREAMSLESGLYNYHLAGNSRRFVAWIRGAYARPCTYLPNLYYLDDLANPYRPRWVDIGGVLRIGIFGATRWQKNMMTACGAALMMARETKAQTEIWVNTQRADGPEVSTIFNACANMVRDLPNVDLTPAPWTGWPEFRQIVGSMHLLMQPSYSESFNMVTADGCSTGVASVISDAIVWGPDSWKAEVDDAFQMARVGMNILNDSQAARLGLEALVEHNLSGLAAWVAYLVEGRFGK
jgi:hypothetical protein